MINDPPQCTILDRDAKPQARTFYINEHFIFMNTFIRHKRQIIRMFQILLSTCFTFRVSRRRREMYCGHARLCVCLSAVRSRMPTLLHGPGCNLGEWQRMPPTCVLLGGFAINARIALLWQHNANAKC